jgi:hypothetical protein
LLSLQDYNLLTIVLKLRYESFISLSSESFISLSSVSFLRIKQNFIKLVFFNEDLIVVFAVTYYCEK